MTRESSVIEESGSDVDSNFSSESQTNSDEELSRSRVGHTNQEEEELERISDDGTENMKPQSKIKHKKRRKISTESQASFVQSISLDIEDNKFKRPKIRDIRRKSSSASKDDAPLKKSIIRKKVIKKHQRRPSLTDQDILLRDQDGCSHTLFYIVAGVLLSIPFIFLQINAKSADISTRRGSHNDEINLDFNAFDRLVQRYSDILKPKDIKAMKARLKVMSKHVSILMLLGRFRDTKCISDPTFCIGQTLSNMTQFGYGYIDGSDSKLDTEMIERELAKSLGGERYSIMIDSLEKVPGSEVMSLFQFIDKDESNRRRGLLILTVYSESYPYKDISKMKAAAVAEKILTDSWVPHVPKDTLTSVISRISGTIVRITR